MNGTPERLLPLPAVLDRTSWSRAKLYDAINKGDFPAPVRLSTNRVAWPESTVAAWIAEKIAASCSRAAVV